MVLNKPLIATALALGALALPALGQDNTLTIYTYDAFAADWGPAPGLKDGFEAQCDCTVEFVGTEDSISTLRRAQLEGDQTEADIILGLDTSTIGEGKSTGLFVPHELDLPDFDMPIAWDDDIFVPFDFGYFAFVYDTESVETPPTGFRELAELPEDFKIVIQDPRSSTPGLGLVLWIKAIYGDEAHQAWEALAPHVLTVTTGWSEAYDLFLAGEADMVLSYTTSPAYHMIAEDEDRYAAAKFDDGHYMQIEVGGILEASDNKDLARDFLAYLVTPEAQAILPETNWMYPVTEPEGGLNPGFDAMIDPEPALLLDNEEVTENTSAWIDEAFAELD